MTHSQIMSMLGTKFYKEIEDNKFEIIRVINIKGSANDAFCICKVDDKQELKELKPEYILSHYTKLIPDGIISFAIVSTFDESRNIYNDDVLIMVRDAKNIENNVKEPDLVCRQNIIDVFIHDADEEMVGASVLKSDLPTSIMPFIECDKIDYIVTFNTYIQDTPDTFLKFMNGKRLRRFDEKLEEFLKSYLKSKNIPDMNQVSIKGHCRNLKTLMKNNNFYFDYDTLYNITPIKDDIKEHLLKNKFNNGLEYDSLDSEFTNIFSNVFKMKISKTLVMKYDHDIDLSDFDPREVFLLRDKDSDLYVVRYTVDGEYLESELALNQIEQSMEHISIVNKYGKSKA